MVLAYPGAVRTCRAAGPVWGGWADDRMSISGQFILPHFEAGGVRAAVSSPGPGDMPQEWKGARRQPFCHTPYRVPFAHLFPYVQAAPQTIMCPPWSNHPTASQGHPTPIPPSCCCSDFKVSKANTVLQQPGGKKKTLLGVFELNSRALVGPGVSLCTCGASPWRGGSWCEQAGCITPLFRAGYKPWNSFPLIIPVCAWDGFCPKFLENSPKD